MALYTYNPTTATTPDPDLAGTLAVTGATATGHAATTCTASGGTDQQQKSCRWSGFPASAGQIKSATLKVGFSRNGSLSDGGLETFNQFQIQYSLNNGSSWTTLRDDQFVTSSSSGTDSVALAVTQDLTQVLVRDFMDAEKVGSTSASITGSISDIRIEVEAYDAQVVVMM